MKGTGLKKLWGIVLMIMLFWGICFPLAAHGEEFAEQDPEPGAGISEELGIDTNSLKDNLPPAAREFVNENGISPDNTEAITGISPMDVVKYVWSEFKGSLIRPIRVLASLMAVILVAAVIESMEYIISIKSMSKIF